MGTRYHHTFPHYWYRLTMVDHTGRYYGAGLRGLQGLNQGYPLSPTIFNVVMDAVVRNWVSLALGYEGGQDQSVRDVIYCATFFYA